MMKNKYEQTVAIEKLRFSDAFLKRLEKTKANYLNFNANPNNCEPAVVVQMGFEPEHSVAERTADPYKMLKHEQSAIFRQITAEDDYIPQIRVEFGTAQIASAFGCELYQPKDSLACAKTHVLSDDQSVESLQTPGVFSGVFGAARDYYEIYKEYIDPAIGFQLPDIQSPFNNAHLVRGNDILFDFYDAPEKVEQLLAKTSDYMIDVILKFQEICQVGNGHIYDWTGVWNGGARLSNCSLHMISTGFYEEFIKKHDQRVLDAVGGGRIHYCGTHDDGLFESLFSVGGLTCVDFDTSLHDLCEIAEKTPDNVALIACYNPDTLELAMRRGWPKKRNMAIVLWPCGLSSAEAHELYLKIKRSFK